VVLGAFVACKPTSQTEKAPPAVQEKVSLGAVFPLTGDTASYGQAAKKGIDLAVGEINKRGGIGGKTVEIIYEDDNGKAANAVSAMEKLISVNKVPLVMGSAGSSVTMAMCPIANREKVVLITPISSSKELTEKGGPFFFRVCPSDVVQAAMMAEWFREDGRKRAAVVFLNTSWGQGLKDEFVNRYKALGGEIVSIEACNEGDRDLRAQLTKAKASNPDALYGITQGREGGALLRQAKELGFDKPVYGADVWGSPELVETAQDAAKGVKIIVPAEYKGTKYQEFAKAFKQRYGEDPDTYAAFSYDMVMILSAALSKADTGDSLQKAMAETSDEGVTGVTKFDKNGDVVGKGFEQKILP
jgi:branched-chain amino acid transport system substrate-binding protein